MNTKIGMNAWFGHSKVVLLSIASGKFNKTMNVLMNGGEWGPSTYSCHQRQCVHACHRKHSHAICYTYISVSIAETGRYRNDTFEIHHAKRDLLGIAKNIDPGQLAQSAQAVHGRNFSLLADFFVIILPN